MNSRLRLLTFSLATAAGLLCTTAAPGQVLSYSVIMNGASESPVNASPGTGTAFITIDFTANTLAITFNFTGLLGTTTAAHIHAATAVPGVGTSGVATTTPFFAGFPTGVTSGSYSNTLDMTQASSYNPSYVTANGGTTASAESALFTAIQGGRAYLNIHSTSFPGGEIRGFLVAVPEPSTYAVGAFAVGLVGLGLARRRRGMLAN